MSWVDMVQKYDLQNTKRPYIAFDKVVTIDDAKHIPQTFNISKGLEKIKALNEAVVIVDKGMYKKRIKQLQNAGFKIESTTPYNEDAQPWQKMNMFVTRKVYKMKK